MIAGRSQPFEPKLAAQRAALIPDAVVDVIDGAGHEVMWTHVDRCVAHIVDIRERVAPQLYAPPVGGRPLTAGVSQRLEQSG